MLVGYARVSTPDQALDLQINALLEAGVDRRHIFEEIGSGAKDDRPRLAECYAFLSPGDTLIVYSLDRLGRSVTKLIADMNDLVGAGIGFRSLTQPVDTTTPAGRLVAGMFALVADYERALTRERARDGMAAAKAAGKRIGRPPKISELTMRQVRQAIEAAPDLPIVRIASAFNLKPSTLRDALKRPIPAAPSPIRKKSETIDLEEAIEQSEATQ